MIPSGSLEVCGPDPGPASGSVSTTVFYTCVEADQPAECFKDGDPSVPGIIANTNLPLDPPTTIGSHEKILRRLVSRNFLQDELCSLLGTVFSSKESTNTVLCLPGDDAQVVIDILDEVLDTIHLSSDTRKKYIELLYKICAHHARFPTSLRVELCDNPTEVVLYRGGFGDVSKREYHGREVAVKTLRIYTTSDLQIAIRRFCKEFVPWKALRHPNVLPLIGVIMAETEFAMVSEWMSNGSINQFVGDNQDANRFELLSDVAKGLIYMHGHGMIHGDLKGANILVDQTCHARLADFGLLTILTDSTSNSYTQGGSTRWMSPELFDLEIQNHRRTIHSDCYALGMVIYEVLSQRIPFHRYQNSVISLKVVRGDRPERPKEVEGAWFTDDVWELLERCWMAQPEDRPSIKDILECLEQIARTLVLPPQQPVAALSMSSALIQGSPDITEVTVMSSQAALPPLPEVLHPEGSAKRIQLNDFGGHPSLHPSNPLPGQSSPWEAVGKDNIQVDNLNSGDTPSASMHCQGSERVPAYLEDSLPTLPEKCSPQQIPVLEEDIGEPPNTTEKRITLIAQGGLDPEKASRLLNDIFDAPDYLAILCSYPMAQQYIDGLYEVFRNLPLETSMHQRCFRALRKVAGETGCLPTCYQVSFELKKQDTLPNAAGGFSDIWKADSPSGATFSLKVLRVTPQDDLPAIKKRFCKEALIAKLVTNPNVMAIEGVLMTNGLCIVTPWMEHGNILTYLKNNEVTNHMNLVLGVTRGFAYLHSIDVIHGNLQSSNVLIDDDGNPRLADFGFSSATTNYHSVNASTACGRGSTRWRAPELLLLTKKSRLAGPTKKSDVYSLAMVTIEIFTGRHPFDSHSDEQVILLLAEDFRPDKPVHSQFTPWMWSLMKKCWNKHPDRRLDIPEVLRQLESRLGYGKNQHWSLVASVKAFFKS